MFFSLVAVSCTIGAAEPATLPDRWLLKLVPADLSNLADQFWKTTWSESFDPRPGGGWVEWTRFAPAREGG